MNATTPDTIVKCPWCPLTIRVVVVAGKAIKVDLLAEPNGDVEIDGAKYRTHKCAGLNSWRKYR